MAEAEMNFYAVGPYSFNDPVTFTVAHSYAHDGWDKEMVLTWLHAALKHQLNHEKTRSRKRTTRKSQAVRVRG